MDNKITFGTRYDLSDKAKLFSYSQRAKIRKMVNKLGKDDVVCIGTRRYKTYGSSYNPVTLSDARIDYILDGNKDSIYLEDKGFGMKAYHSLSSKEKNKIMKERTYKFITDVLGKLQSRKSVNPKPLQNDFLSRTNRFDDMHETKLDVRQWSRFKQSFGHDKFSFRLRDKLYSIKDNVFTDLVEGLITSF